MATSFCRGSSSVDERDGLDDAHIGRYASNVPSPDALTTTEAGKNLEVTYGTGVAERTEDAGQVLFDSAESNGATAVFTGRSTNWGCMYIVVGIYVGPGHGSAQTWTNKFKDKPRIYLEINNAGDADNYIARGGTGTLTVTLKGGSSGIGYTVALGVSSDTIVDLSSCTFTLNGEGGSKAFTLRGKNPGTVSFSVLCIDADPGSAQASATVVGIDIRWGTTVVSDGQNHDSIVGLGMDLSVVSNPSGYALTNIQWTIPGTTFTDWPGPLPYYIGFATPLDASFLTSSSPHVFTWIDKGSKAVSVTATVDGTGIVCDQTASFNVKRPEINITPTIDTVDVHDFGDELDPGPWELRYGWNEAPNPPGILLRRGIIPADMPGATQWVQTIDSTVRRLRDGNTWSRLEAHNVLDTKYPAYLDTPAYDAPGQELDETLFDRATCNDSFKMHMMYKPNVVAPASSAMWVPLKVISWSWSGDAEWLLDDWFLNSGTNPPPTILDETTYPTWLYNVKQFEFEEE
jgi:hypothetical protein